MGRMGGAIAAALVLLQAGHALAQAPTATQSAPQNKYPDPRCTAPKFQALPQGGDAKNDSSDAAKTALYDYEVRQFNREAEAYHTCLYHYIDKASHDARQIQEQANADVKRITDKANAQVGAIRAQIHKANSDAKNASTSPQSTLTR
jgi:hypothetical protein